MEKEETQLKQHQETLLETCKSHNYAPIQDGNTNSEYHLQPIANEQVSQNVIPLRQDQKKVAFSDRPQQQNVTANKNDPSKKGKQVAVSDRRQQQSEKYTARRLQRLAITCLN
uniref:Uncharacterized protein n=1 Tax=Solanum tuberosum TaxID=4113 RepID=M1DJG2_SOLTU